MASEIPGMMRQLFCKVTIDTVLYDTPEAEQLKAMPPLTVRNAVIPITNFGAKLSMPLLMIGLLLGYPSLVSLGILAFSLVTFFQLITLPVEYNASSRAMRTLVDGHILRDEQEIDGTRRVLSAAALTYVAALILSAAQLLRLILLFGRRRRD